MADPIAGETRPDGELNAAQNRLDALSRGECDEGAFLRSVQELTRKAPDAGWDLLSLLDQYYRRGKIKSEVFRNLKSRLEGQLLGTSLDMEISAPLPQKEGSAPEADATAPIAATIASDSPSHGAVREIAPGDVLRGRYVIKSVLGRGGTGTVLEAIDPYRLNLPNTGQRVAIKVLHAAVSQRPELLTQLRREFQRLQSLSHPNIVRAYDCDSDGDTEYFTMEYLSGLSLGRVLPARHYLPLHRSHALSIIRDVGAALAHAHSRGVVHGDLNPGNIFITNDGEVRVLDFGASSIAAPRYASCQLLDGEPADARDDLYALACIVYQLLAGQHPFAERTATQARAQGAKPSRPPGLTRAQWRALRRGLAFGRDLRPADVAEWLKPFLLREAPSRLPPLLALLRVSTPTRGRWMRPALGAAALAVLAAGWWVAANFEWVARAAAELSVEAKAGLASAHASLARLWPSAPDAAGAAHEAGASAPVAPPSAVPAPPVAHPAPPPEAASLPRSTASAATATAPEPARPPSIASAAASAAAPHSTAQSRAPRAAPAQRPRIELAADTVEVPPADPAARVMLRRTGNLHGEVSFSWWTESGTAKPGRDFAPVAPREEHIEDGKGAASLFIPVVADATRSQPKSFYVVISEPNSGASLGKRTLTMVTIPPSE